MKGALGAVLVCAALAASPASAFDNPAVLTPTCTHNNFRVLEAVLPSILARSLLDSGNSEGLEAARFLNHHLSLPFRIAVDASQGVAFEASPVIAKTTVMAYSHAQDEIHIHHALLHVDGNDEEKIIQTPALLEKTARLFWAAIVHEISHARDFHLSTHFVAAQVGEEEYIAHYREVFFLIEQLESEPGYLGIRDIAVCGRDDAGLMLEANAILPRGQELAAQQHRTAEQAREFDRIRSRLERLRKTQIELAKNCPSLKQPAGDSAILLSLFARSQAAFEGYIDFLYEEQHLLRLDAPDLIAAAAAKNKQKIAETSRLLAGLDLEHRSRSSPYYDALLAQSEGLNRVVQAESEDQKIWENPALARAGVAAYKAQVAAIRAEAAQRRERYRLVLKPFSPVSESPTSR